MTIKAQLTPAEVLRRRNHRHQAGHGIPTPLAAIPDEELIQTLVSLGQPRWSAEQLTRNPQLRLAALRCWVDVGDAGAGDPDAKERVDYIREQYARMRRDEIITDDPHRGHHLDL